MCGIAGLVTEAVVEPFRPAAQRMAAALRHRGPDSCGIISSEGCLLANTRLAILDLSERGRQPMGNAAGNIWLTYNGETYNASELRQDLLATGYLFHSATDTEVVLHLYEEYGDACVNKMRGMFAFAIWDARSRKLLLARDRLGIKPLYFTVQDGNLIFASEMKALLASHLVDRGLNHAALRLYLQLGHVPQPWTMIGGIHPLPAGHVGAWQHGTWDLRPYWRPCGSEHPCEVSTTGNVAQRLGELLFEATHKHLISDVPVALFLSGGTDSACLGALARNTNKEKLTAITVGFSEREFDETSVAAQTARALAMPFTSVVLSADRVTSQIDACVGAMDQPTVDGLNSYWISQIAAELGFKVALSGQGADELFGGYTSWKWFMRLSRIAACAACLPARFGDIFECERWPYRWRKLSYLFGSSEPFIASQTAVKVIFPESDIRHFSPCIEHDAGICIDVQSYLRDCAMDLKTQDERKKLSLMDIRTHLQPRLLRDLDAMSMAHSLEIRPVFLDDRVVEFVLSLPTAVRREPKKLLLEAVKRIMPGELLTQLKTRAKHTFTFPLTRWLSRELKPLIDEAFSPSSLRSRGILEPNAVSRIWKLFQNSPSAVGWSRIWVLFILAKWCEAMDVRS